MIRLGLLSFSDGRERVHQSLAPDILAHQAKIKKILEDTSEIVVIEAPEIVFSTDLANQQARHLDMSGLDGVIFNIPVFAFPHFSVIAAQAVHVPILLLGPRDPRYPGLGGLLGAAGALNQVGITHERIWVDLDDPATLALILSFAHASAAHTRLKGQVYGLIGGRSLGMYTGAAPAELWQKVFGVDIDHIDQSEIIRKAKIVPPATALAAGRWLEKNVQEIVYDGTQLTPDKLDFEVRCWIAVQEIVDQFSYDFVGLKCHYDMSEFFSVQCLAAAFINDPYDWRGPKKPVPLACEADSDGALTMQILTLISGNPSCLLDLRFFDPQKGVLVMPNCGAAPTWYASRSQDPAENLQRVKIVPSIMKYAGGGAHIQFVFCPGPVTLARLARSAMGYKMLIFRGETVELPVSQVEGTGPNWPHAFVRSSVAVETLVKKMEANHLHAVAGDWVDALIRFCQMCHIDCEVLSL
jgi:L-fucose isomerase